MRVLVLRGGPSVRPRIQAAALRSERPEIELALARGGARGGEQVPAEWELGERPARALRETIAEFAPDLIHSHGPPELFTVCASELVAGRIPVIYDASDRGDDVELERRALEESAALIVASQALLEEIGSRHPLPSLTCVFPNYPLAAEHRTDELDLTAEANIGRLATLYERLVREPLAGIPG